MAEMVDQLIDRANQEITSAGFAEPSEEERDAVQKECGRIRQRFRHVVPAEGCRGIADILNAAWQARRDQTLWADAPHVNKDKDRILKDRFFRNIEVFEIEQFPRSAL